MSRLSLKQIEEYNHPIAFSRPRTVPLGGVNIQETARQRRIQTSSIEQSFRLVTNAMERLDKMSGNLLTMLDLARQGTRRNLSDRQSQEIYGKLRSLSAGFDQIIDATRFSDRTLFNGSQVTLNLGGQTHSLKTANLRSNGDGDLNLSSAEPSADIRIRFRADDVIMNQQSKVLGLNLTEASFIPPANGGAELNEGVYKLEIIYKGPESSVLIRREDGRIVERQDNIDLSGSGQEWIDFDSGFRLSIEKENIFNNFDKFDYENLGPGSIYATLSYETIEAHVLRTDVPGSNAVTLKHTSALRDSGGAISVSEPRLKPADPGKDPLDTGFYQVEIDSRGEYSIARLRDSMGRIKGFIHDLDLTQPGKTSIDFGVGFSFELENTGFSSNATLYASLEYSRALSTRETFDYKIYMERILDALDVIDEQHRILEEASILVQDVNRLRNMAINAASSTTLRQANASSILAGAINPTTMGIMNPAQTQGQFAALSNQLFQSANAQMVQANQSPQDMAALQSGASAGWLSHFV